MSVIQTSPLGSAGGSNQNVLNGADSTSSIVLLKRKKKPCPNNMIKVYLIQSNSLRENANIYLFDFIMALEITRSSVSFLLQKPTRNAASMSSFIGPIGDQVNRTIFEWCILEAI